MFNHRDYRVVRRIIFKDHAFHVYYKFDRRRRNIIIEGESIPVPTEYLDELLFAVMNSKIESKIETKKSFNIFIYIKNLFK